MKQSLIKMVLFVTVALNYYLYIYTKPFYRHYYKKYKSFYKRFSPLKRPLTQGLRQCNRRTVVDMERNFLFNRIAKVASSALMATLCPVYGCREEYKKYRKNHKKPSQLDKKEVEELAGIFKFVFVRNPYDRVLSAYLHKIGLSDKKRESYRKKTPKLFKKYGNNPTFYDFCRYLENGGLYENKHWAPQASLMAIPPEEFDFIGKIENIKDDFKTITQKVKAIDKREIARTGPYTGASDKKEKYYDQRTADIVFRLYKEEFRVFGYKRMSL